MQLGMIGLGRMGSNMAQRLINGGHECVVFDLNAEYVKGAVTKGAKGAGSLGELVQILKKPRHIWIMVPAGEPTENTIRNLFEYLEDDDVVIEGGNTYFKDDIRRAKFLAQKMIHYVDVGTSGGIWGLERGYCLMIGGDPRIVNRLDPIFKTLAPGKSQIEPTPGRDLKKDTASEGYLHCGKTGAGHFVKMVHNGIEYGLMQAYAEGFDIFYNASRSDLPDETRYQLNIADIAEVWRRGSVVSSWLLDLTAMALLENPDLSQFSGSVQDSGEGRWTIQTAIEQSVPVEVLSAALYTRFRSREGHTFAEKILSAMRNKFGGHIEKPTGG